MAVRGFAGKIREANLFVGGMGFLGKVESVKLPEVKTKKDFVNGQHVDLGILEAMEFEAEVNSLSELIYKELSKLQNAELKVKGAIMENGVKKSAVATLKGPIDVEHDTWKSGENVKKKIKMYVNVFHLEVDGKEEVFVDLPNYIARIGGTDIYEDIRNAIM